MSTIRLERVGKTYGLYRNGIDRLLEAVTGRSRHRSVVALSPMDLHVAAGEIVGVIGKNGAGKSTLLKLVSGMIPPTSGHMTVEGKVAPLLELGAGFHPGLTGRENLFLVGAAMGMDREFITRRFDDIVGFSEIGHFIDMPVKTYSSGMFVRLAFSLATSVQPDILIIDEALSVGDGSFARRSFDRIMRFREAGVTILFCSHSMYQVEALCSRVIWLKDGNLELDGDPQQVVARYNEWLSGNIPNGNEAPSPAPDVDVVAPAAPVLNDREQPPRPRAGTARFHNLTLSVDGSPTEQVVLQSGKSELGVTARITSDPDLPVPTFAVIIRDMEGRIIASAGSLNDGVELERDDGGLSIIELRFPSIPLLKGRYFVDAFLMCEKALHVYDGVKNTLLIEVTQTDLQQGVVSLVRRWSNGTVRAGGSHETPESSLPDQVLSA